MSVREGLGMEEGIEEELDNIKRRKIPNDLLEALKEENRDLIK